MVGASIWILDSVTFMNLVKRSTSALKRASSCSVSSYWRLVIGTFCVALCACPQTRVLNNMKMAGNTIQAFFFGKDHKGRPLTVNPLRGIL